MENKSIDRIQVESGKWRVESGPEAPILRGGVESCLGFAWLDTGTPESLLEAPFYSYHRKTTEP